MERWERVMARFGEDTITRQIRQLGDMIAAIVARARSDGDYASGLEAIRGAGLEELGIRRALLDAMDPASAAMLLRDPHRRSMYADLCSAEAELLEGMGRTEEAARLRGRAAILADTTPRPAPTARDSS
jgi:hypothetical protein